MRQDRPLSRVPLSPSVWTALFLIGILVLAVLAGLIGAPVLHWIEHR